VLSCSVVQAQVLSTDEKIEILGLGGQSSEIINFVAASTDYTLQELEQANELKKQGVNDKNIILVLKSHAKLTNDEILKLKDYQTKGYAETIIQKSLDEKPKFGKSAVKQQNIEKEYVQTESKLPFKSEKKQKPIISRKGIYIGGGFGIGGSDVYESADITINSINFNDNGFLGLSFGIETKFMFANFIGLSTGVNLTGYNGYYYIKYLDKYDYSNNTLIGVPLYLSFITGKNIFATYFADVGVINGFDTNASSDYYVPVLSLRTGLNLPMGPFHFMQLGLRGDYAA
jgi:hypothetical protein